MSFDVEVPGNRQWKFFPAVERLTARKGVLDLVDRLRREERHPLIGHETERRLLDYELADLDESMDKFMKEAGQASASD